jgi:hypothetical protein
MNGQEKYFTRGYWVERAKTSEKAFQTIPQRVCVSRYFPKKTKTDYRPVSSGEFLSISSHIGASFECYLKQIIILDLIK